MSVLPDKINDRIAWFEQRLQAWQNNAAAIGVLPAQVLQLKNMVTTARANYNAAQTARAVAKDATVVQGSADRAMTSFGSDLIQTIKLFAQTTNNATVYQLSSVPPPAAPTPAGPPKAPTNVIADPNADGTITITWKGSLANSTFYTVWRKPGSAPASAFTQITSVAGKKFIDTNVPGGVSSVNYYVRAQRDLAFSAPSEEVTVNFPAAMAA